ncbi:hypothetical protein SETIT_5G259800v2 [Setaria italica]|uniref:Uncharacterized protein n=1 Tax=Setaria italica TaxID=4555 RepID=A0A368R8U8_SETIT|nr:hypothetical protein SETIT_5G259800v2 [Setaria italica]
MEAIKEQMPGETVAIQELSDSYFAFLVWKALCTCSVDHHDDASEKLRDYHQDGEEPGGVSSLCFIRLVRKASATCFAPSSPDAVVAIQELLDSCFAFLVWKALRTCSVDHHDDSEAFGS